MLKYEEAIKYEETNSNCKYDSFYSEKDREDLREFTRHIIKLVSFQVMFASIDI